MTADKLLPKIVFLTGAGLSADSGLKTYRGEGGLYNGMRAEKVLSAWTMKNSPGVIQDFCDDRRQELASVRPNPAHDMIRTLSDQYPGRVSHFTMNVDGLAGGDAIELHGALTRMRSIGNSKVIVDIGHTRYWSGPPELAPDLGYRFRCPKSNSHFRPDVVLFEEMAPQYSKLWKALKGLRRQDCLVVIGTQGNVLPVEQIAQRMPGKTILNNLHVSEDIDESVFNHVIRERASVAASEIEGLLRLEMGSVPTKPNV